MANISWFLDIDDLYDKGKIDIKPLDYALMINPTTTEYEDSLLSDAEKGLLDEICDFWKDKGRQWEITLESIFQDILELKSGYTE